MRTATIGRAEDSSTPPTNPGVRLRLRSLLLLEMNELSMDHLFADARVVQEVMGVGFSDG